MHQSDKYPILVEWSEEDEEYVATTPAFPYLSVLEASEEEAVRELRQVLGEVLASRNDKGVEPPEPSLPRHTAGISASAYPAAFMAHWPGRPKLTEYRLIPTS